MIREWDAYYPREEEPTRECELVDSINWSMVGAIGDISELDRSLVEKLKRRFGLVATAKRTMLSRSPEMFKLTVTIGEDQYIVTSDYSKTPDWWDPF